MSDKKQGIEFLKENTELLQWFFDRADEFSIGEIQRYEIAADGIRLQCYDDYKEDTETIYIDANLFFSEESAKGWWDERAEKARIKEQKEIDEANERARKQKEQYDRAEYERLKKKYGQDQNVA